MKIRLIGNKEKIEVFCRFLGEAGITILFECFYPPENGEVRFYADLYF